jgi:hypothetical protein
MTRSRFFQLSLFFPVLLWVLGMLGYSLMYKHSYDGIISNLFDALRVFVPYFFFAAIVWRLADNKPYRALMVMTFVIPIIWGIFFTLCYMPYSYFKERLLDWYILCIMGFWATFVAYFAELIPYLILVTFKDNFKDAPVKDLGPTPMNHASASPEG